MNDLNKLVVASAALTFALAANITQSAAEADGSSPKTADTARATNSHLAWTVVRVSVSSQGDVEGMRIAYQSGDRSFDRTALQTVSRTTFAPIAVPAKASTFDYLLMKDVRGKRTARILPAFPGDAQVSVATVSVREAR